MRSSELQKQSGLHCGSGLLELCGCEGTHALWLPLQYQPLVGQVTPDGGLGGLG